MRPRLWSFIGVLVGLVLLDGYAAAQTTVVCTPVAGVIVANHNGEFVVGEGIVVLGVISGDLNGGTFSVWPPPGRDTPVEGVITLASGDALRVQAQLTVSEIDESGFMQLTQQVTIRSGTGAYQRASGSFEAHGSVRAIAIAELVMRYQGEVCVPAR